MSTPDWWLLVGDETGVMGRRRLGARDFEMTWIADRFAGWVLPAERGCVGISREGTARWWVAADLAGGDIRVFAGAGMHPPTFVKGGSNLHLVDAKVAITLDPNGGWLLAEQVLASMTTEEIQG